MKKCFQNENYFFLFDHFDLAECEEKVITKNGVYRFDFKIFLLHRRRVFCFILCRAAHRKLPFLILFFIAAAVGRRRHRGPRGGFMIMPPPAITSTPLNNIHEARLFIFLYLKQNFFCSNRSRMKFFFPFIYFF